MYSFGSALSAVMAAVCSVTYLFFGLYIISQATKDKRIRPLFYLCIFSSAWSCCYIIYYLSSELYTKEIWQRFIFAGMLVFTFVLFFFIKYVGLIKNKKTLTLISFAIWLPPLIYVYKSISENAVARDFPYGFWYLYVQILTTIYNLAGMVLIVVYHIKHKTNKSRRQTIILLVSAFVLMTISWILDYYFGFKTMLNIRPFWLLVWVGILSYTIKKYRFITVKPDFINRDISENIEEGIILFDPDMKIIFTNSAAQRLLNAEDKESIQLQDFIPERHLLDEEFSKLKGSNESSFRTRIYLTPAGTDQKVPVDIKMKKVIDDYKDISGFLMIITRAKSIEHLKALYKITDRELQIVLQLATGKTNKEIADYFRLTLKTVETHITSIYSKLLINNRIELINILSEYNSASGAQEKPRTF